MNLLWSERVSAPAKLNLGLEIIARLPSSYHALRSVIVPISLADTVSLEVQECSESSRSLIELHTELGPQLIALGSSTPDLGPSEENLVYRSVSRFADRFLPGRKLHFRLRLDKRIPWQAGLGGGSSDAAAVLRSLSRFLAATGRKPDLSSLLTLALQLGADVPALLLARPCLVQGIGGLLTPLTPLDENLRALEVILIKPLSGIATKNAFASISAPSLQEKMASAKAEASASRFESAAIENRLLPGESAALESLVNGLGLTMQSSQSDEFSIEEQIAEPEPDNELTNSDALDSHVLDPRFRESLVSLSNDFEGGCSEFSNLKSKLIAGGALHVTLAGSGSAVAGFFEPGFLKAKDLLEASCGRNSIEGSDGLHRLRKHFGLSGETFVAAVRLRL